ncbi:NAD-dependent protein deacetylase HST1 isoform X2 [Brassica napus]|uniref:NAD-dependent protein deacetylase HST1 isoform X2 n=1 Tax=Brassica napus TaxID=3708 RepID=UPI0020787884|nr:NAD-dependent protein deacetylase HST1 isoform X2 [Brassica napus]
MAPRRGRRKKGLMREDAARDAMRAYGFEEGVIKVCIKELLELYGGEWFLIEEFSYSVLLNKCLEKQAELDSNVAEEEEEEMAEEHNEEMAQEEQDNNVAEEEEMTEEQNEVMAHEEEEEEEQEQHVEYGRDHVGSNSASLVGCGAETAFSLGEASVIDYASPPVAFHSSDYAHHSVGGAKSCGWLSDEEDSAVDDDDDDDDEMIQLTPEPLCEELKELLREVRGEEKKRKRPTRWDT